MIPSTIVVRGPLPGLRYELPVTLTLGAFALCDDHGDWAVYHLPSGLRVEVFRRYPNAVGFLHALNQAADWSSASPDLLEPLRPTLLAIANVWRAREGRPPLVLPPDNPSPHEPFQRPPPRRQRYRATRRR